MPIYGKILLSSTEPEANDLGLGMWHRDVGPTKFVQMTYFMANLFPNAFKWEFKWWIF